MDIQEKKKLKFEQQSLQRICQDRRKQNFDSLKVWDQVRAQNLILHRKVADQIEEALQTRITESDSFLRVVSQFLSDCEHQQVMRDAIQKKIDTHAITNPETKIKMNLTSRTVHMTTAKCLMRLYEATQNSKGARKVRALLEQGIRNIENMLIQSERDIMEARTKIELKAVEIQNQNELTIQKCDKFVAAYHSSRDRAPASRVLPAESDLFYLQSEFLGQSVLQTNTQQEYGALVIELLNTVCKYEQLKLDLVRETLLGYLVALEETTDDNESLKLLLHILEKKVEEQALKQLYSSEELLDKDTLRQIRQVQSRSVNQKLQMQAIAEFMTKIKYQKFDSRNLVLKQYRTYLKIEQELENSYTIMTVDAFLHVYQYGEQLDLTEAQPIFSFRCNSSLAISREGDVEASVQVKKWQMKGLSQKHIETISLVFLSEDQRQEFMEFLAKLAL